MGQSNSKFPRSNCTKWWQWTWRENHHFCDPANRSLAVADQNDLAGVQAPGGVEPLGRLAPRQLARVRALQSKPVGPVHRLIKPAAGRRSLHVFDGREPRARPEVPLRVGDPLSAAT